MTRDPHGPERELGRQAGSAIAFAFAGLLHAVVAFFYFFSGLLAPAWAALVLVAVWVGLAVVIWRWRRRGAIVLAVPFVAATIWGITMYLGDRLLGWTA